MGIDWTEEEFGDDCACYPAGRTPKYLYASIMGVEKCNPGAPPFILPNKTFKLEQVAGHPCQWRCIDPDWIVDYIVVPGVSSQLGVHDRLLFNAFNGFVAEPCIYHFESTNDCATFPPIPLWGGGTGIVISRGNDPLPSLQDFAALFNLNTDPIAACEIWPATLPELCIRYARPMTPTNFLMKVDFAEYDQYDMFEWV